MSYSSMTVVFSSVDVYCTAIALLTFGEGLHANTFVGLHHISTGSKFSTYCDGITVGLNNQQVSRVEIIMNGTKVYQAAPGTQAIQVAPAEQWDMNVTWVSNGGITNDFNVTITIPNAQKSDEGRLSCEATTPGQINLKHLLAWIFVNDRGITHQCPSNWGIYPPLRKCLNMFEESLTWSEANHFCKEKFFAHLVVIPDATFDEYLTNVLGTQGGHVWIGLTDKDVENTFKWTNGDDAAYRNWASNPQSSTATNCVEKDQSGNWRDVSCNKNLRFICERLISYSPNTHLKLKALLHAVAILVAIALVLVVLALLIPRSCFGASSTKFPAVEAEHYGPMAPSDYAGSSEAAESEHPDGDAEDEDEDHDDEDVDEDDD